MNVGGCYKEHASLLETVDMTFMYVVTKGVNPGGDEGDISPPCFDMGGITCLSSPPCFDPQICCFFVLEN